MQEKSINKTAVIKMTVTLLLPLMICLIPTMERFRRSRQENFSLALARQLMAANL